MSEIQSMMSTLSGLGGDMKPVERKNIHLTLKFLGNVSAAMLAEVRSAMSRLRFSPFQVEVKGAGAFPSLGRMSVIWVGVEEGWTSVQSIYEQTETALAGLGFKRESRAFSPHVTVARVRSGRRRDEIASFLRKLDQKAFGSFKVDKVRLKQSVLSSGGPKYTTIHEVTAKPP